MIDIQAPRLPIVSISRTVRDMRITAIGILACLAVGCSDDGSEALKPETTVSAAATLAPTAGNTATGTAAFTATGAQVKLTASIANAPPNSTLGFHIHVNAACGSDGMEAGGHWNPTDAEHGKWDQGAHHLGDIGNVNTDESGKANIEVTTSHWTIGTGLETDIVNHAVILHAMADDFATQPTGNAGARISCGVIQLPAR